jgi:hypothetical protein
MIYVICLVVYLGFGIFCALHASFDDIEPSDRDIWFVIGIVIGVILWPLATIGWLIYRKRIKDNIG